MNKRKKLDGPCVGSSYIDSLPLDILVSIYGYDPTYPNMMRKVLEDIVALKTVREFNLTITQAKMYIEGKRRNGHSQITAWLLECINDADPDGDNIFDLRNFLTYLTYDIF